MTAVGTFGRMVGAFGTDKDVVSADLTTGRQGPRRVRTAGGRCHTQEVRARPPPGPACSA